MICDIAAPYISFQSRFARDFYFSYPSPPNHERAEVCLLETTLRTYSPAEKRVKLYFPPGALFQNEVCLMRTYHERLSYVKSNKSHKNFTKERKKDVQIRD